MAQLAYTIAQPTREWVWRGDCRANLYAADGSFEITQDPADGLWNLYGRGYSQSIAQSMVMHQLVMLCETL